jgi:hypothetical protein
MLILAMAALVRQVFVFRVAKLLFFSRGVPVLDILDGNAAPSCVSESVFLSSFYTGFALAMAAFTTDFWFNPHPAVL